ncbi:tetratricopeptide repeat-containing sensor histidine kinase [Lutibacter oricola]|uniref:tetratricopeptide repeat-containing sensor histidine kinase n=1 Tax=Lutibacter oricola TaxID=762486 RepID=UPI0011139243|nr:sensor histidine kinase [Lutibacter oricola]
MDERILFLDKAFETAKQVREDTARIKYFRKISLIALSTNKTQLFKVNKEAIALATKLDDSLSLGDINWNYAGYYTRKHIYDSAYYYFNKSFLQFKTVKHDYYVAQMLYNLSFIQGRTKDYTGSEISAYEAINMYEKLDVDIYKRFNKNQSLYNCYNHLGLVYRSLKEYDKSIIASNKALEYLKKSQKKNNFKEWTLGNLGLVYRDLKEYDKSISYFEKSLENSNLQKENLSFYVRVIDNIAYTKFLKGDTLNVYKDLNYALRIRDSLKNNAGIVLSKMNLAKFLAYRGDTAQAIEYAKSARKIAFKISGYKDRLEMLSLLSKLEKKNSVNYLNNYIRLNDSLNVEDRKTRNKFTRIRFETDEYIEKTEILSQQKILILGSSLVILLFMLLAYLIRFQRSKNKELLFEKEQEKSNQEILSLMLKQQAKLEEGRFNERNRIAADLHDGVLGKIFGTRLGLGFLNMKGDEETMKQHQLYIDELQSIEKEIRTISHELKSEILFSKEDFNVIIEDLIIQKAKLGNFKYEYNCDKQVDWLTISDEVKINYYRIIQEALQNIIKYSNADLTKISVKLENEWLTLKVEDNGIGFNSKQKKKGIGLKNMRSRVKNLGGMLNIKSEINMGTQILVSCEIKK